MKRYLKIGGLLVLSVLLTVTNQSAIATDKLSKKQIEISVLIETINRLSATGSEQYLAQDSTASYNDVTVAEWLKIVSTNYSANAVATEYERRMITLSEAEDADSLLTTCIGALATGIVSLQPMACEGIVQIMANRGNATLLEAAIRRFEMVATTEEATKMRNRYDDILNPVSFADLAMGTWVSPEYITSSIRSKKFPYYMLHINSLANNGIQLLNIPGETTHLESSDISSLCQSQMVGGTDGHIVASFGSEYLKRGDSNFAKSGFEMTRDFRANSRATIASSKTSFENKLVATTATELTAGLLDALFSSTAQSHKHIAALNIDMTMKSPQVMSIDAQYYNYTVSTSNPNYTPTPYEHKNIMMVKWEPEDGVYFVDSKNRIFSITPQSQLDLSEYNAIMTRYSYKRSKYLLPTIAGIVGGAAMMAGGIAMACNVGMKDEYGNQLYDPNGARKLNNSKLIGGVMLAVCGELITIIVPIVISDIRMTKRAKALTQLNEQQASKLSQKGRISISPVANPLERELNICATLTF